MSQNMRKLSIGAGRNRKLGYQTVDIDPSVNPDFCCAVPPLPDEIKQWPWIEVEMFHAIEHLYLWDAQQLVSEVYQILEPGGKFVLEQPNIMFAAAVLLGVQPPIPGTAEGQCDMWPLYGDPNHKNPFYCHRWGYSPRSLMDLLVGAGFDRAKIKELPATSHIPIRDFRLEAEK